MALPPRILHVDVIMAVEYVVMQVKCTLSLEVFVYTDNISKALIDSHLVIFDLEVLRDNFLNLKFIIISYLGRIELL